MTASHIPALIQALGDVKLLAVSKQQSIEKIQAAIEAGIYRFGENYLQEALPKINALKNYPLEWHFIGRIQANKTGSIAHYFDWVHSLDRKKIAVRLNNQRPPALPPLNVCIEINLSQNPDKSGIPENQLADFINYIQHLPHLKWRGLMTMITQDYEKVAKIFYDLKKQGYDIDTLSMGMTKDYQKAIQSGATLVRLGTHIFGERTTP
jgi:pyridoxal phosphate enzyme (YggS family)